MEKYKVGQELEFDVYGNQVKGKFISMLNDKVITIEVTYDSLENTEIGCTANVNESFILHVNYRYYKINGHVVGVHIDNVKHQDGEFTFISGRLSNHEWIRTVDLYDTHEKALNATSNAIFHTSN